MFFIYKYINKFINNIRKLKLGLPCKKILKFYAINIFPEAMLKINIDL